MFCPVCKGEFREGFTHCDNCNVDLVTDLDNITEKVDGEFMLCPNCHTEYHEDEKVCPECGLKLFRAVLNKDDEYVFLEEPKFEHGDLDNSVNFNNLWRHYCQIDPSNAAVVLESMDGEMLKKVMDLLDKNEINFMFVEPNEAASSLGSIFGVSSPLERQFPRVVVRKEDEERALSLIANSSELGLFEVPEELMDGDDDEENEDDEGEKEE